MAMEVTVDKAGRIVFPKAIRVKMHLEPGTKLLLEEEGGGIRMELKDQPKVVLVRNERGQLVATTTEPVPTISHEDVLRAIDQSRQWPRS